VLESRPDIALVYANCYVTMGENETFREHTRAGAYCWIDFDRLRLLHGCFMGPQPMWRRSLHEKYGYFDENIIQPGDWDLWLRFAEGETFLHIDEFLGLYLYSPDSREHREPELSQHETELVRQRYMPRETELREREQRALLKQPAQSGIMAIVVRSTASHKQVEKCVEQLSRYSPTSEELFVKVVKAHADLAENELGVNVSPKSLTVLEALNQGMAWEAKYVLLISPDVDLTEGVVDALLTVAESDDSIAAVGPTSNAAPAPQRVESRDVEPESEPQKNLTSPPAPLLQGEEREPTSRVSLDFEIDSKWEEVSYLGGFCLLLKSRAIQQVGGLDEGLSLNDALWQLYTRLRTSKYKLACAQEVYVLHAKLTNEEGANYDELTAAEIEMNANAKRLYESGDVQGAERMFKRAIQMNPNFVEPYNNLAVLYWQEGQTGAALYKLTEALQVDANDVGAVVNYGLICKELAAPDIAQQIFEAFLQRNPDATEVRELLEN